MNIQKRQARAKARALTMRLRRQGVPCFESKWGYSPTNRHQRHDGLTPGEVMSARKKARRDAVAS